MKRGSNVLPLVAGIGAAVLAFVFIRRRDPPQKQLARSLVTATKQRDALSRTVAESGTTTARQKADLAALDARIDALRRALMDLKLSPTRTERLPGRV